MAFASQVTEKTVFGNKRIHKGTFTNGGGDSGGDIQTGLQRVDFIKLQHTGSSVVANAPVVNETFPLVGGAVTIVTDADADGIWEAEGV